MSAMTTGGGVALEAESSTAEGLLVVAVMVVVLLLVVAVAAASLNAPPEWSLTGGSPLFPTSRRGKDRPLVVADVKNRAKMAKKTKGAPARRLLSATRTSAASRPLLRQLETVSPPPPARSPTRWNRSTEDVLR